MTNVFEDRTIYSINNEEGERSTITLDKFVADVLQACLPDVHDWIQRTYDHVCNRKPNLSRREKGDVVRLLAVREAEKYPQFRQFMNELL